jgi:inhibitor of cysteine peptidase
VKGKWYVIALASIALITTVSIFIIMQNKQHITMPTIIMSTQSAKAYSHVDLHEKSIENEWVFVTNNEGEKIDVPVKVMEQHTIEIDRLKAGRYELHIQKKALQKKSIFTKNQTVRFEVIEKLAPIKSKKELDEYFEKIVKLNESNSRGRVYKNEMATEALVDSESSDSSYSSTNNQVEGIEEADVAVTDGEVIYTVSGSNIFLIDAKDPVNLKQLAAIRLKEYAYVEQLVLHENYLIVAYSDFVERNEKGEYVYESYAKIGIYDITNKQNPKFVRDYGHEGYSVAIRKTNDTLYFITQNSPDYWAWYREDSDEPLTPAIYDSEEGGKTELSLDKISILPNSTEPNFTTISAIDLSSGKSIEVQTESYLGSSAGFYMSHNAMYLTAERYATVAPTNRIMDIAIIREASETSIYRFSVDGTNVSYSGQTTVEGSILNQFSMDEHNGYFRVATTKGQTRGADANSTSAIIIFDSSMNQVGKVSDLAKGERIYSARFMGDRAYIVTFKEIDPLFTFDLSNPTNPKVLGELKIPGYSTYLHPVGENHLLGLGYHTEVEKFPGSTETFVKQVGLKLSLFNVTDLNNPIEQDVEIIGGEGTYSQAIHTHKAFFIHQAKNLYGFPVSVYDYHKNPYSPYLGEGAMLYTVTPETGITVAANLISPSQNPPYEVWEELTQRILYINDAIYLVKQQRIVSYDLNSFNQLGSVRFQ